MARFDDLAPGTQKTVLSAGCIESDDKPWVSGPALSRRKVAIVSTAGLLSRGGKPFRGGDHHYHAIPNDIAANDLLISHLSVNFDRTGFQQDINVVFPRDRLNEMAEDGTIGSVADTHYSFMGATDPKDMADEAKELARRLKADDVDSVLLLPV